MTDDVIKLVHRIFNVLSIVGVIASVIACIYLYRIGVFQDQRAMQELILTHRFLGPLIFIGIQIIQVVIPIIPGGISTVAGVLIFGPWLGFIYNYVGIVIGSIILFHLGRVYGRSFVSAFIKDKTFNKYMVWGEKGQKRFDILFFIAIFLPVAPDDALCLIASQTKMSYKFYLFTIFVAKPFPIYLYSYLLIHGAGFFEKFL